jgi:hypothetical protein
MASADITTKDTIVKGVNSENNYVRSEAHILDGTENSGILAADTHDLFVIPKGNALVGLKVIALSSTTSGGSATVQFKAKVGTETATAIGSAIAKANLAAGFVHNLAVATLAYSATADTTIEMTVGTAALTAVKLLVIAEYIPVDMFMNAG